MIPSRLHNSSTKISRGLASRLDRLKPAERIRLVLLLHVKSPQRKARGRSHTGRQAAIDAIRSSAASALGEIDSILKRFHGQRLAEEPSVLGTILVETTAAGTTELAASDKVKGILEDQPISVLETPSR